MKKIFILCTIITFVFSGIAFAQTFDKAGNKYEILHTTVMGKDVYQLKITNKGYPIKERDYFDVVQNAMSVGYYDYDSLLKAQIKRDSLMSVEDVKVENEEYERELKNAKWKLLE